MAGPVILTVPERGASPLRVPYDPRRARKGPRFMAVGRPFLRVIGRRLLLGDVLANALEGVDLWKEIETEYDPFAVPAVGPLRPVEASIPHAYSVRRSIQRLDFRPAVVSRSLSVSPKRLDMPSVPTYVPSAERGAEERLSIGLSPASSGMVRMSLRRTELSGLRQKRKDQKSRDAVLYRAGLRMIGRTYGRFSEYLDAYEAFMWNVYVDGVPLARHERPLDAALSGRASVDGLGMARDLLTNEVIDRVFAARGRAVREASRGLNIGPGRFIGL